MRCNSFSSAPAKPVTLFLKDSCYGLVFFFHYPSDFTTGMCTQAEANYVDFGELQTVVFVQPLQQERQLFTD